MMNNELLKPLSTQSKSNYVDSKYSHSELTSKIIACCIEVHSCLGPGLLESLYEEALAMEFEIQNIKYEKQKQIELDYKGKSIGNHRVDFLVDNEIIVELKAVELINNIYLAQLITYLKVLDKQIGLLINFNVEQLKQGIKRIII